MTFVERAEGSPQVLSTSTGADLSFRVRGGTEGPKPGERVVVGMSGGVDSSVCALLLKRKGYDVVGLFMKNWDAASEPVNAGGGQSGELEHCSAAADYEDVARVCEKIGIPYFGIEFVEEYRERVFASFLSEIRAGRTPNPDILCNREIKFDLLWEQARALGGSWLATGHYARLAESSGGVHLLKGLDPGKDQSYFLSAVPGEALRRVLFPIGDLLKSEVRRLAAEAGLPTADKKDSTGICFIGERKFREFLSQYVAARPGVIRTLDGVEVGRHAGVAYYTIGQRRGLELGGQGEPWFVVGKDVETSTVYVERGVEHPALYADELMATAPFWVGGREPAGLASDRGIRLRAKIRYRQADQDATVWKLENGNIKVVFDRPQRAITPSQAIVFYGGLPAGTDDGRDDCLCFGGAWIERAGPTYWEQKKEISR